MPDKLFNGIASRHRIIMTRFLSPVVLALASVVAYAEDPPYSGMWRYDEGFNHLSVHLRPFGDCSVLGHVSGVNALVLAPCKYILDDPHFTLYWTKEIAGSVPEPLHFTFVADGYLLRMNGDPQRILRWAGPSHMKMR
jgi:hypothetical protein